MSSKMHLDRRVPVWEDGKPIIDPSHACSFNPHWSKLKKLKKSVHATNVFKAGGKKRAKRLSQVVKARRNSATSKPKDEI